MARFRIEVREGGKDEEGVWKELKELEQEFDNLGDAINAALDWLNAKNYNHTWRIVKLGEEDRETLPPEGE